MAEREIIDTINRYILILRENGIQYEKVILFGSNVSGTSDEWSDIDIAVVSSDFGKDHLKERLMIAKLAYHIDPRLEVHPIGSYEYGYESWKTIVHAIKTTGLEIAA
jgi:predicted nucleotidyltransferase